MISKYLERRVELYLGEGTQTGGKIQMEYYLVESDNGEIYGNAGDKVYGIEISKKERDNYTESEIIRNLYSNKDKTQDVLRLLAENTVTPVELPAVLDDIMAL